ncbi:hypothetical protein XI08_08035 [Bradyrhizobium sp. CCBAU 11361]|nr:hypothetical protein [Bradyrhizobium sp. CCBAU 11361]
MPQRVRRHVDVDAETAAARASIKMNGIPSISPARSATSSAPGAVLTARPSMEEGRRKKEVDATARQGS